MEAHIIIAVHDDNNSFLFLALRYVTNLPIFASHVNSFLYFQNK